MRTTLLLAALLCSTAAVAQSTTCSGLRTGRFSLHQPVKGKPITDLLLRTQTEEWFIQAKTGDTTFWALQPEGDSCRYKRVFVRSTRLKADSTGLARPIERHIRIEPLGGGRYRERSWGEDSVVTFTALYWPLPPTSKGPSPRINPEAKKH